MIEHTTIIEAEKIATLAAQTIYNVDSDDYIDVQWLEQDKQCRHRIRVSQSAHGWKREYIILVAHGGSHEVEGWLDTLQKRPRYKDATVQIAQLTP